MIALALALAAASPVTAVLELRNKLPDADRNLIDAAFLTDVVRQQALEAAPSIKLMTRENVLTLLEASGKKLEDCEGECEVDTGRRLGADLVVTGELLRFGSGFRANLRLHDTHTAQLLSAAVASGDNPEALEKDLVRAVAKLMIPASTGSRPQARSDEWVDAIGLYLTAGIGLPLKTENDTPVKVGSTSYTVEPRDSSAIDAGLGVRYFPANWLMLDAAWLPLNYGANANASTLASSGKTFAAISVPISASYLMRVARSLRAFAGAGVQVDVVSYNDTAGISPALTGPSDAFTQMLARPFARFGAEWRPQDRVGIGLFGVVYPIPEEIDVYVSPTSTMTALALKYTLPWLTGNASIAFYF